MESFEEQLKKARQLLETQDYKQASRAYLEALKVVPDDEQRGYVWAELSWVFYQLASYQSAIDAAKNALQYHPDYQAKEDLYRLIAFSCIQLGDEACAIDYLEKSVAIDRDSVKQQVALYELAKLYFKNQTFEKARKIFEEIEPYFYQNDKEYWFSILFYKGFIYYYEDELTRSEQIFEELLENSEDKTRKATALYGLAYIAFKRKQYLSTINLCEAVTTNDPNFFDMETIGFLTAASFYHLGREDVFDKYYEQLRRKYPNGRYAEELKKLKTSRHN